MLSKVSKNELNNWINELLKNNKIIKVFGDSNNCFIIHSREKKVEFDNTNEKLKNVFKKSGLYHFEIGFSPSLKFTQEGKYFHSKNDMFGKKIETFNAYDSWFSKLFDALNSKVILIPDTNIIKYCVYTNYLKRLSLTYSIQIPRLTILEVESQYNRTKGKDGEKVRSAFQDMVEILKIEYDGGEIIPFVDKILLETFAKASGNGLADAWIRMEVAKYILDHKNRVEGSKKTFIFLSSDLMNSLSANAEDLNVLYFFSTNEQNYDNRNILSLIINTAVAFEKCRIETDDPAKKYEIEGMWNGKNPEEWKDEIILFKGP